ncbi:hypothetical protein Tco_0317209 [Tanacetum coccineum]
MSRTNSQAEIVFKEQLVSRATRLVIKKNNPLVASDSHITDTMLRFVVEILRHHKLYKPVSLTATMPHPDPKNTYTKPPLENQILEFIKTLGYDEDPETKMIVVSKMILWGIVHSANLDFTSLIWDEYEWQAVERSSIPSKMSKLLYTRFTNLIINHFLSNNKSIPRRSSSKLHSSQDDQPITKLSNTVKVESENAEIVDEPEEKHASPVKSGRGKGFMCYGDQVANVPTSLKIDDVPRKTRSQTIAEETVVGELANSISIQELRTQQCRRIQLTINSQIDGPLVLIMYARSKASRLESLKQKKRAVVGEGSSAAHNKYYDSSDTDSDAILYSSSSDKTEESDDADEYDMDLSNDNPDEDDDATGHPVYTDAQTTSVVYNPEGNLELTSYISGASGVPLGTYVLPYYISQSKFISKPKQEADAKREKNEDYEEDQFQKPVASGKFRLGNHVKINVVGM